MTRNQNEPATVIIDQEEINRKAQSLYARYAFGYDEVICKLIEKEARIMEEHAVAFRNTAKFWWKRGIMSVFHERVPRRLLAACLNLAEVVTW